MGLSGVILNSGKWYYEVEVISPGGVAQIGWCDLAFRPELSDSWGVGDDRHRYSRQDFEYSLFSWAFDGSERRCLWHEKNCGHYGTYIDIPYLVALGDIWRPGDIVGCAVDFDKRQMQWSLNGKWFRPVFTNFSWVGGLRPSMCAQPTFTARFIFDDNVSDGHKKNPENCFKFAPPSEGYQAVMKAISLGGLPKWLFAELALSSKTQEPVEKHEVGNKTSAWLTRSGLADTSIDVEERTVLATQNYPTLFLGSEWRDGIHQFRVTVVDAPSVKQVPSQLQYNTNSNVSYHKGCFVSVLQNNPSSVTPHTLLA